MPYIVIVEHNTKTELIPTEITDTPKAIARARMENQGPGYDWQHATVGFIPDGTAN
jgi:hypothetical protein